MANALWAALASASYMGTQLASANWQNDSSRHGQRRSYEYASALQQQAQQWAEHMASTAHQREVQDLHEAGLNPILSATGGSGAVAPASTAGTAIGQNASQQPNLSGLIGDVSQLMNVQNQTKIANAQADNLNSESALNVQKVENYKQDLQESLSRQDLNSTQKKEIEARIDQLDDYLELARVKSKSDMINALANQTNANTQRFLAPSQKELNESTTSYYARKDSGQSIFSSQTVDDVTNEIARILGFERHGKNNGNVFRGSNK